MAWDGTIYRHVDYSDYDENGGSVIHFSCGHTQKSNLSPADIMRECAAHGPAMELPCFECSKPNWDKIAAIREGISFDEVLEKLKER